MLPEPYYQDSAVTIYHGDCRNNSTSIKEVDLWLTDPPYGSTESIRWAQGSFSRNLGLDRAIFKHWRRPCLDCWRPGD